MVARTVATRLLDIIEAIERASGEAAGIALETFKADWRKRWIVERGIEVISEASRHLTDEIRARHPDIPWRRIAGIGNVLRHNYDRIAADVMWRLVQDDLPMLDQVCRDELAAEQAREQRDSGGR